MKRHIIYIGVLMLLLSVTCSVFAQSSVIIKGIVSDKNTKEPLGFVNIVEIDKNGRFVSGVVSDVNGNYMIKVKDSNNSIQASFIGYTKSTFKIDNRTTIDVQLESESESISEIVVRGEVMGNDGITKVRDRGTAVARMEFKDMESVMTSTVEEMMQGRLGNVDITSLSGDPGAGINIRIRGTSSLNANNDPLIVVNGIPYQTNIDIDLASADIEQFGSLIDVSPEDIESIEVLKDAASTAVWGSKAASGVLMIKTKRGIKSKPIFEYTVKTTLAKEPDAIPMLDGAGYAQLIRDAHYNQLERTTTFYGSDEISFNPLVLGKDYYNYTQNTDWVKEITQLGQNIQNDFSVSGGGEKTRYNMSVGYSDEKGTTYGNNLKKLTLRSSLDYNLSSKLMFRTDIMYTRYDQDMSYYIDGWEVRSVAYRKMPNLSVFDRDTTDNHTGEYFIPISTMQGEAYPYYNPVAFAHNAVQKKYKDNARALFTLKYDIMPGLIYTGTVTLDIFDQKLIKFLPHNAIGYIYNSGNTNLATNEFSKKSSIYTINQIIYKPNFGADHDFASMFQVDTEGSTNKVASSSTSRSASPYFQDPINDKHLNSIDASFSEYSSLGAFATTSYKYKDKYIFMAGVKLEGNSKFSPESRWGFFPTTSLAWRISEEPFLKWATFINDFKIRGSWGQTGNAPSSNYLYFNTYSAGDSYSYVDMQGVRPDGLELTSLRWETVEQINAGVSFYGIDNRLNIEFDVYNKTTRDLYLKDSRIPSATGFSSYHQNNGEMYNRGIEFMVDYKMIKTKDFEFSMNFNASRNENAVVWLPKNVSMEYGDMLANGQYKINVQPGLPLGGFYGYKFDGVYETTDDVYVKDENGKIIYAVDGETPLKMIHGGTEAYEFQAGDAKYRDTNYDGKIDELDIVYLGDLNPDLMGGGGFRLKYKGLVLNTFFHYKVGQKIINQTRMDTEKMYNFDNQSLATNWRWRREGDSTHIPRALFGQGYNWLGSDRFVENGSFIRLKTVSLSYIFDKKVCSKLNVKGLKVYTTAYNVFTWTNYSGQDPDVGLPNSPSSLPKDTSKTPPSRRIMIGLNVKF